MSPRWTLAAIVGLFTSAVLGAWLWFRPEVTDPVFAQLGLESLADGGGADTDRVWLTAITNIPGYRFVPDPISPTVLETLGTTNIINGTFYPVLQESRHGKAQNRGVVEAKSEGEGDAFREVVAAVDSLDQAAHGAEAPPTAPSSRGTSPIRMFFAQWRASAGQGMSVVQHTPDICWVGAGWRALKTESPSQMLIPISALPMSGTAAKDMGHSSRELGFEKRLFLSPDQLHYELAVWTTLLGGRVMEEAGRWSTGGESRRSAADESAVNSRTVAAHHFLTTFKGRHRPRAGKQFARLSIAATHEREKASSTLNNMAAQAFQWSLMTE